MKRKAFLKGLLSFSAISYTNIFLMCGKTYGATSSGSATEMAEYTDLTGSFCTKRFERN